MKHRLVALGTILGVSLIALTGCSEKFQEPFNDAERSGVVNHNKMDVIEMSDGFSNLGTKCDHGNRIYVAYHGDFAYAALAVVGQDPTCPK